MDSDAIGVITEILAGNPELMADPILRKQHDMMATSLEEGSRPPWK